MKYYFKIRDREWEMIPMPELYRMMQDNDVDKVTSLLAFYKRILLMKSCALNTKREPNSRSRLSTSPIPT